MAQTRNNNLARFVSGLIETEIMKDDPDMDFIENCEKLLDKIIIGSADKKKPRASKKVIRKIIIGCAAAALLGVGACAAVGKFVPAEVLAEMPNVARLLPGEGYTKNGVDYKNLGKKIVYKNIESFRKDSGLDVMFFDSLPKGVRIKEISRSEVEYLPLDVKFTTDDISFSIYKNPGLSAENAKSGTTLLLINSNNWYLTTRNESRYVLCAFLDDLIYQFNYPAKYNDVVIEMAKKLN